MCRTLSQNSTRLGIRLTTRTSCARVRKKQLRTGFQPVEQKRNRRQIRELFPSGAVRGRIWPDLAKSGAPAAILINAYSGDFCHPVLSNALGQEPLVYHSGTRELFSDIFGTFSEISTFSRFSRFSSNLTKSVQICKFTFLQMRAHSQNRIHKLAQVQKHFAHVRKFLQMCKCVNVQMCKCAKNRRAQNAQICSANIFPNAEITNLHCAQKHKCKFHKCANLQSVNFFLCKFLCASFVKIIYT